MNKQLNLPTLVTIAALTVYVWGTADTLGEVSLKQIPLLAGESQNEGRCMTPDGLFIGGLSANTGLGWYYDAVNDIASYLFVGSNARNIVGMAYRTDTNQSPAQKQLIVHGESAGWHAFWMSADGGTNWLRFFPSTANETDYGFAKNPPPAANSLAGTTGSDVFVCTYRNAGKTAVWTLYLSNLWSGATSPQWVGFNKSVASPARVDTLGVAATGRIVGLRRNSGDVDRNQSWDWAPASGTAYAWYGLDGTTAGQAWSVSRDGNVIFGWSHTPTDPVNNYGCRFVLSGTSPNAQPPGSGITQVSTNLLPEFPDTSGSTTRSVPHGCTPDGKYAVGYAYTGITKAVLWDTSDANPANWTITDLYALAAANGTADIFNRLEKAYSVGTNAAGDPVITGYGYDAGLNRRAFVMTVPKWVAAIQFPINVTTNPGANVTFALRTNGVDSLAYQWYKNGSVLSGETTTALSLTGVTCPADVGTYSVVITNASVSGVVTGAPTLTITDPVITQQPLNQTNNGGTTASFTVTASGSGPLTYQWKRGGIDLSDGPTGSGSIIAGASTSTLYITNVQSSDEASYSVAVSVVGGCTTTSASRTLTVLPGLPVFTSIVPDPGGSYTLTFNGWLNQTWYLYYSPDVTRPLQTPDWTWTGQWGVFDGNPVTWQDVTPGDPQRFYVISYGELPAAP